MGALVVFCACQGAITDPSGISSYVCNATGGGPPVLQDPAPLRRLTRVQYINVVSDIIRGWLPANPSDLLTDAAVLTAEGQVADDSRVTGSANLRGGLRRLDQEVQQDLVDATFAVAQAVGTEIVKGNARLHALLGECATNLSTADDDQCVENFIRKAGRIAERRELQQDDVDFYKSVYASTGVDPAGISDVVTTMLMSPYLFYQVEHGDQPLDEANGVYALSGQELANRLTLQFWGTIPDDTLNGMIDSGAILTDSGYASAVAHVAAGAQVDDVFTEFFREYLSLEDLAEMSRLNGTPRYDAMRGSFHPTGDTRENMIGEATNLTVYYAHNGGFADLFTTRKSFATTDDVAQIYGVAKWSGTGVPPDMPDTQHVGLLTHAALVASGLSVTRPVIKGVVIRNVLMCDEIGQPPANAMMVAQDAMAMLDPLASTRSLTQSLTETRPDCAVCHANMINPLGFTTENFDPLGRLRQIETVFDDSGKKLGQVPIDTSSVPQIMIGDMTTSVSGAADLQAKMLASNKLQDCMARKYFRFTFGKLEEDSDSCSIKTISTGLSSGGRLGQVMLDVASTPAFKQRRFN
jgi:hypothetical protein